MRILSKGIVLAAALTAVSAVQAAEFRYRYVLSDNVPYDWQATDTRYDEWVDKGDYYSCTNWSPSTSTIGKGIAFTQTATNCKQDQTRTAYPQQEDSRTGIIQDVPDASFVESRTISTTHTRESVGILENWQTYDPTYTDWTDTNSLYGCTSWSPDPSIYTTTTNFTQNSATCKTDQTRQRQDREMESFTSEIRNDGTPVTENQTLNGQAASRPYSVTLGEWGDAAKPYACTNWSPDPNTIGKSIAFTQNATDCKIDQQRTRAESYVDHKSGSKTNVAKANEKRTLTSQKDSRDAVGVREDWSATSSVYGAWTNTVGKIQYSCSNWTPTGASKTTAGAFTQTATDCKTDQTRTRQDREIEANTSEIRNKGSIATENQTLTGQTATRSYTVGITAWANNGAVTSCSNWSPDPSTVTINKAFTQTATDCLQPQKRTRSESYVDHLTGSTVAVSSVTQTQSITASSTRAATGTLETWAATTSVYSAWANTVGKVQYSCTNWSPAGSTKTAAGAFTQTATDCKTDQTRTRQDREMESTTKAIRNKGSLVTEKQTLASQTATRSYTVGLTAWANNGAVTSCTNWSPDPSTVTINKAFTQTATDCLQPQKRTRSESYVDHLTGSTVAVSSVTQTQSITASSTRAATGTLETWAATTSTYSAWANTVGKVQYSCTNWSPAGSTKTVAGAFTQTATDCKTDQTRTRQDREMESTTKAIRNKGSVVTEKQTLTAQKATRSYTVALTAWANNGAVTSCTNWSPAPATVTVNKAFAQTATDCLQPQKRTRSESYVDHLTGSTVAVSSVTQTQSITASSTRAATGTLETWAATTSTYSAWANTAGKVQYSCTNWSPAGSTKTAASVFTQTATDCKTDQTRTRQDREMESTTKAIRNKGSVVTEKQTLTAQSATRSYTVALTAWANNGAVTSCTNWSPAPATVTINKAFTQTATNCVQAQTRTRSESYVDHLTGSKVAVSSVAQSQSITASSTRAATGTKETWAATSSVYSAWTTVTAPAGCTGWSPSPSSYTVRSQFTQTGTGCSVTQNRTRQDRQYETTTGAVRNNGVAVTESQVVGGQTSSRSYLMDFNDWWDVGGYYSCSAWSPDASTVNSGTAFAQYANCYITQNRGAAGYTLVNGAWAADPAVPYRTEAQAIVRYVGQTAIGTKPTIQCLAYDGNNSYIQAAGGRDHDNLQTVLKWAGSEIYRSAGWQNSVATGGYTYTMGGSSGVANVYGICRQ
jgi:Leu/Phe-tRNA-protein transferase